MRAAGGFWTWIGSLAVMLPLAGQAQTAEAPATPGLSAPVSTLPMTAGPADTGAGAAQRPAAAPAAAGDDRAATDGAAADLTAPAPIPGNLPDGQHVPVLTVDQEVLYARSDWGLRAQAEFERDGRALAAENDRLAAQLAQEEAELTERRKTLSPTDFRQQAEAFDQRATRIRAERAAALRDLNQRAETDRSAFFRAVIPIIGTEMQARGAVAVLDQRTVFLSLQGIDMTAVLITRINDQLGDGSDLRGPVPADQGDAGAGPDDAPQPSGAVPSSDTADAPPQN